MVTDRQVKELFKKMSQSNSISTAAMKADMSINTARKYLKSGSLPTESAAPHIWRTRSDPFESVWSEVTDKLEVFPGLEAKTLFEWLQREHPGDYSDGQMRTLQRRIKQWRCAHGQSREVYFDQRHYPGDLCESDFTHMDKVNVTINGIPFKHMLYHFVLTYSNWEDTSICFSESLESLLSGFQNAVWHLGGVPKRHRTDRLSAAINNLSDQRSFTRRYKGLLSHYRISGEKTNPFSGNENGDVEQRHHRFKRAIIQRLSIRGSFDFENRDAYEQFLRQTLSELNAGRLKLVSEELEVLRELPDRRLETYNLINPVKVKRTSIIRIAHNSYSVPSRLINETVSVRLYSEHLEIWYGQKCLEHIPRLYGEEKSCINYRHIIDWLIRKPGAFENYRYKSDLFPTTTFRIVYDMLCEHRGKKAVKEYLEILHLAAYEGEDQVEIACKKLLDDTESFCVSEIKALIKWNDPSLVNLPDISIDPVDLASYDQLMEIQEDIQ